MGRRQRNNRLTMTAFLSRQSDCGRHVRKNANASTFNFTPRITASNLHGHIHEARKVRRNNAQGTVQAHINELSFYAEQALPLVWTRFLRLAHSSLKAARIPARRSRDGRETPGKKSGEMSRVISAQRPGNGRTVAAAMSPSVRQDDLQDNLPCAGFGRAMAAPETCETTRNTSAQWSRNDQCNVSQAARRISCRKF
jgi:hypothetical protein